MGFINLGTRVGDGSAQTPYVINYSDIRTVNCDDIMLVAATKTTLGNGREQLVISITYKFSQESTFLLVQKITYTASSTRPDLELTASQYQALFTQAISSVSNTLTTINAPEVNEFNPGTTKLIPVDGSRSFTKSATVS